jgi:ABC-type proline/glycine betaine transport system permease subunit
MPLPDHACVYTLITWMIMRQTLITNIGDLVLILHQGIKHDGLATLTMISRDLLFQIAIEFDYFSARKHAFILLMNDHTSHLI